MGNYWKVLRRGVTKTSFERIMLSPVLGTNCRGAKMKARKAGSNCDNQLRDDDGLNEAGGCGNGEKWLVFKYTLRRN